MTKFCIPSSSLYLLYCYIAFYVIVFVDYIVFYTDLSYIVAVSYLFYLFVC